MAKNEERFTTTHLHPGLYRLAQPFTHPKPDRRRTGPGLCTPDGFAEGTRFTIRVDPRGEVAGNLGLEGVVQVELLAPFGNGLTPVAHGMTRDGTTRWWIADEPADVVRSLLTKLVVDDREESWLDDAMGASRHMTGHHADVLLHLLETGRISRADVTKAFAEVEEKLYGKEG